jgi:hypothetical protein
MSATAAVLTEEHQQNQSAFEKHASLVEGLEREEASLSEMLAAARSDLGTLTAKRTEIARQIALGKQKPTAMGSVSADIGDAEIRVHGFESLLNEKRGELASQNERLSQLRHAAHDSGLRLHYRAQIEALEAKGGAAVARINQKLLELLTVDFVEWHDAREGLMGLAQSLGHRSSPNTDPILHQAVSDAHSANKRFENQLWDNGGFRVLRDLDRQRWLPTVIATQFVVMLPPVDPRTGQRI